VGCEIGSDTGCEMGDDTGGGGWATGDGVEGATGLPESTVTSAQFQNYDAMQTSGWITRAYVR
jgi:hypothetical protein